MPIHRAVPTLPPAASAAMLAALASRATARLRPRYITVIVSFATGTQPGKNVTLPVADDVTLQATPSDDLPANCGDTTPVVGFAAVIHAEPVRVRCTAPMAPKSSMLFTATTEASAGEVATAPS